MVNIDLLMKEKKVPVFVPVKGRANQEHVTAAIDAGISADAIIEAAYAEVYEQLSKKNLLGMAATNGKLTEKVKQAPERGEVTFYEGWKPEEGSTGNMILKALESHMSMTNSELRDMFPLVNDNTMSYNIFILKKKGLIIGEGDPKKMSYCLMKNRGKNLEGLFPKGTKAEVMR